VGLDKDSCSKIRISSAWAEVGMAPVDGSSAELDKRLRTSWSFLYISRVPLNCSRFILCSTRTWPITSFTRFFSCSIEAKIALKYWSLSFFIDLR